jgi:hypothetical protein
MIAGLRLDTKRTSNKPRCTQVDMAEEQPADEPKEGLVGAALAKLKKSAALVAKIKKARLDLRTGWLDSRTSPIA